METKRFQKGEVIFQERSFGNTMYEIRSGSVGVYLSYGKPEELKLTELGAVRIFGEMAVIEVSPRSATVAALEDVELLEITTADIRTYFDERPEKLLEIMRSLSRRTRELTDDYNAACAALGEWKDATRAGGKKRAGLMDLLARFAEAYNESVRYANLYIAPGAVGAYY